jgi:hypothetical protein
VQVLRRSFLLLRVALVPIGVGRLDSPLAGV